LRFLVRLFAYPWARERERTKL